MNQVTLQSYVEYNPSYPPQNAKKGYVAKITGRESGPTKYQREFLGTTAEVLEGDDGLYERQIGSKKGGHTRYYHVVLTHPEHGLIVSQDCEDTVPKIAKLLDTGHALQDIIEVTNVRDSAKYGKTFDAVVRTAAEAKKSAKSATLDSTVDHCWEVLSLLPPEYQRKVLTELRKRIMEAV